MNSKTITREELCGLFDHTNLKAYAQEEDFKKLCDEAAANHFAMVAINSAPVALCHKLLKGSGVHVGAAISFPLGQTTVNTKAFEAEQAIQDGADEIDYVIHIGQLKQKNTAYIKEEMETMVHLCRSHQVICKVIFENCYLTKEEIKTAAEIAREVRPDFIKTSTGFGTSGALYEDVLLMKKTVGDLVKVKAAGGIRDWETCSRMIDAGAERIGTSSGLLILEQFDRARQQRG
ncbi:deoxyribose-phosphate aldolase [Lachnospiraceae bacterium ASD3451]|uniref:deoxyribose-phosphate aldolase n=1 Tax=Diplocloster agilis TaxID=2850323 RepID=UPI001DD97DE2|nr:deoxyribose-phosphate aldolase [Diplocloster agilis]MBU9744947.1 deoxyribose-phosphate aldolase [Diplocloster agilis]